MCNVGKLNMEGYKLSIIEIVLLVFAGFNAFPQVQISGVVINEKDKTPIPYVAIGMLYTTVGTISELDGSFEITIPQELVARELLFSALGFERKNIFLADYKGEGNKITISLKEKILVLDEVTVKGKAKLRRFEFGNREFDGGSMYAHTQSAGSAMVMLVDNSFPNYSAFKFPAYLDKVFLRIINNTFGEFKLRLRLYLVDSITGKPGRDMLEKDVIIHDKIRNGWLELTLSEHNIRVNGPFFIGFEWILDAKDRAFLYKQYSDWYRKHPQLVTRDSVKVGSKFVHYSNYNGTMWAGTSFGTAANLENASKFKCHYRYNSFGEWFASPTTLCMRILLLM